jgi:hypothetical protein
LTKVFLIGVYRAGEVAQVVKCLASKHRALSSTLVPQKERKGGRGEGERRGKREGKRR